MTSLLDTPGAASYLGVAVGTLEKARTYGGGPKFARLLGGRAIRYRVQDLDDYVSARTVASTSETTA